MCGYIYIVTRYYGVCCMGGVVIIRLPYPVSVNAMYRNVRGRGRVKTKKYLDWIGRSAFSYIKKPFDECVVHIKVKRPDKRKRDIDNIAKGILDLLVHCCVLSDDRCVEKLIIEWVYDGPDGATIEIRKIED